MTSRWLFLEYGDSYVLLVQCFLAFYIGITNPVAIQVMLWTPLSWKIHVQFCIKFHGGAVHGSQFKNADCVRKFPHSGMMGCWAIRNRDFQPNNVSFRYKYDRTSRGRATDICLCECISHATMMKHKHSNQRAWSQYWNSFSITLIDGHQASSVRVLLHY